MISKGNSLFGFDRALSYPFELFDKIQHVTSEYSTSGKTSTLLPSFLKAYLIYNGFLERDFAVGITRSKEYVAELKSSVNPDIIQMAIYDSSSGNIKASCRNIAAKTTQRYNFNKAYRDSHKGASTVYNSDGTLIWLALMPVIMDNKEVITTHGNFEHELDYHKVSLPISESLPSLSSFASCLGFLSDNVYRRCTEHQSSSDDQIVIADIGTKGPLRDISSVKLDAGQYMVAGVLKGEFVVFNEAPVASRKITFPEDEYDLGVELSEVQKKHLIPLPSGHVTTYYEKEILDIITTGFDTPALKVSNFLLIGPPGSGKSESARAIASYLGLPYYTIVCSENTSEDDLRGCILPKIKSDFNEEDAKEEDIYSANSLPSELELRFNPSEAYKKITGEEQKDISALNAMECAYSKALNLLRKPQNGNSEVSYVYEPSPVVMAFKYGGVLEIQEPSAIMSPTVLTKLNDVMNGDDGILDTPIGSIKRNPYCIVIGTNNPDSDEGYRTLNQAVKDRFQRTYYIETPPVSVMKQRILEKGIHVDDELLDAMGETIEVLDCTAQNKRIKGTAGMRSFIEWAKDVARGQNVLSSLMTCVINKMTTNPTEVMYLNEAVENSTNLSSFEKEENNEV